MKKIVILLALIAMVGCRASRPPVVHSSENDSVRVEYRERVVEVPRVDTVKIDIPVQVQAAVVTDSSHLETDYAVSDAYLTPLGMLSHTLENKPVELVEVIKYQDKIVYRDSIVYQSSSESKTIEVKKPLNKLEKGLVGSGILFWLLLLIYGFLRLKGIRVF